MAADFSIKAHDRMPPIEASLSSNGFPVDLTTATQVRFIMRLVAGGAPKVAAVADIVGDPQDGNVSYSWAAGDTDEPGQYQAEWEITWTGGLKQTAPTTSYHSIDVLADLDDA